MWTLLVSAVRKQLGCGNKIIQDSLQIFLHLLYCSLAACVNLVDQMLRSDRFLNKKMASSIDITGMALAGVLSHVL